MSQLGWLTARPVAHRGLHDLSRGIIENTRSAFAAAIDAGYAIETDVQNTRDGEAMVHHDDALGRLTDGSGRLADLTARELAGVAFRASADRMMTLAELCELAAGRVTLVIELKSHHDGDERLVRRTAETLARYRGKAAAMSFDSSVVAAMRRIAPDLTRGLVAQRQVFDGQNPPAIGEVLRAAPHFVAYSVQDLPAPFPFVTRSLLRLPLLTWTVRSDADRTRAARYADQMIFEGFRP